MGVTLDWLALAVSDLDRAVAFYTTHLDLAVADRRDDAVALAVESSELRLLAPGAGVAGGVHTHYALTIPTDVYKVWWDRLEDVVDLTEHDFGGLVSLYFDDPDDHCVELAAAADASAGQGIVGVFEVVLEVADLDRAEALYRALGGTVTSRAENNDRVRLDMGAFDIELWTPRIGIAGGRGGVHVDLGLVVADPVAVADRVRDHAAAVERLPDDGGASRIRIRDPDGHTLTLRPS